jgi:protein-S-isoprenylcysteine O-methyltransferase Ste14
MKILRAIGVFITTALIYLGIPLAGWGILKIGSFFGTYHYSGYAVLVFTFSLLVGIQAFTSLEGIQDGPGAEGIKVHRQSIIGSLLIGTLAVALFIIPFLSRHGIGVFGQLQIISWFGVALCGFGYLLIYWSGLALGKQYSAEVTLQKDHKLITTGPYRFIRHPRYTGILSLGLGIALLFQSWIGPLFLPWVLALILYRVHDEEIMLQTKFGKSWQEYTKRSKRFIPGII